MKLKNKIIFTIIVEGIIILLASLLVHIEVPNRTYIAVPIFFNFLLQLPLIKLISQMSVEFERLKYWFAVCIAFSIANIVGTFLPSMCLGSPNLILLFSGLFVFFLGFVICFFLIGWLAIKTITKEKKDSSNMTN